MPPPVLTAASSPASHDRVSEAIIQAKSVVVLTGAGISTSARIPDFRSKDGLYNLIHSRAPETISDSEADSSDDEDERPLKRVKLSAKGIQGKDLFSANVFRQADTTALFYTFAASLYSQCIANTATKPTPTHHFIRKLSKSKKLLRCYTQNIDSLEGRTGLDYALDQLKPCKTVGNIVQLHGRVDKVQCGCGWQGDWTDAIHKRMKSGLAADCPACDAINVNRANQRKRAVRQLGHYGKLKPAILLYDDPSPPSSATVIMDIEESDLARKPDLVIVMGSSLKVGGFKSLIKDFVKEAKRNKSSINAIHAILVNDTDIFTTEWQTVFDCFVMDKCDSFVERVTKHWKLKRPNDWLTHVSTLPFVSTKPTLQQALQPKKAGSSKPSLAKTSSHVSNTDSEHSRGDRENEDSRKTKGKSKKKPTPLIREPSGSATHPILIVSSPGSPRKSIANLSKSAQISVSRKLTF